MSGLCEFKAPKDGRVQRLLSRVTRLTLDSLFPLHCLGCGKEGAVFCSDCEAGLHKLEEPYCTRCARPNSSGLCRDCRAAPLHLDGIRAPYLMEGPIREAVHQLKYQHIRAIAPTLGGLMAQYLRIHPLPADVLAPVPLHRRRLRQRGYNQSALLAQEVAKRAGLPADEALLRKTRDTFPQVGLSREQRLGNVVGSFECAGEVEGKAVLLIDDVATTGSTLSACGEALRRCGARSVWGLVLAREG